MTTATRRRPVKRSARASGMGKAKEALYWRTWASVCVHMGWKHSASSYRYALHLEAECKNADGSHKSMKDFTNDDFTRYLDYCSILLGKHRDGERAQLCWRVRKDARDADLSPQYLAKLSTDLYGLGCWEELSKDDLEKFRNTVHNRAYAKAPKRVDFIPGIRKFTEPDFPGSNQPF